MDGNLQNVRQDANETFHAGKKNKTNRVQASCKAFYTVPGKEGRTTVLVFLRKQSTEASLDSTLS